MNREMSHGSKLIRAAGFTLIELLVVIAIKGSYPFWNWGLPQQRLNRSSLA